MLVTPPPPEAWRRDGEDLQNSVAKKRALKEWSDEIAITQLEEKIFEAGFDAACVILGAGSAWRPIAHAPPDDTWWHVWVPDKGDDEVDCVVKAHHEKGAWDSPDCGFVKPTHYRPLPGIPRGK